MSDQSILSTRVKNFSFHNHAGGTGRSNWDADVRYTGEPAQVRIIDAWLDGETGYRFIGVSDDPGLDRYLDEVAGADRRVFFGQDDVVTEFDEERMDHIFSMLAGSARNL